MNAATDKKIKILFGINRFAVGGAERLVLNQLQHIDTDRFDAHAATLFKRSGASLDDEAAFLGERWEQFAFSGFLDPVSFWHLYRYLRKEKFDAVVTSLFFVNTVLRFAAIMARVPIILTSEVNVNTGKGKMRIFVERFLARKTDRILPNSKEVCGYYQGRLGLPPERFTLVYSGIDVHAPVFRMMPEEREKFRQKYGCAQNEIVITTAGRMIEQKGHTFLIDAFANLIKNTSKPVRLIIFGDGELREQLSTRVRERGLEEFVSLPGVAALHEIIAITDIFAFPSLWEGMSLVLLEAMAGGLPVVATDVSGTREIITDSKNGFLVSPKDSEALEAKIRLLVDDEELRIRMASASLASARRFSIENTLDKLYGVIDDVKRKKSGRLK